MILLRISVISSSITHLPGVLRQQLKQPKQGLIADFATLIKSTSPQLAPSKKARVRAIVLLFSPFGEPLITRILILLPQYRNCLPPTQSRRDSSSPTLSKRAVVCFFSYILRFLYFFFLLNKSIVTAPRRTIPLTTFCISTDQPISDIPLFSMPMISAPITAPMTVPVPPYADAPPM